MKEEPVNQDRIVFLDAGTVDYGDISLKPFEALGPFCAFRKTEKHQIARRVENAGMVITNKCVFDAAALERFTNLRAIHVCATGVNNVDCEAARCRRVAVTRVAGYSTESVVQATLAFLLALAGNLTKFDRAVHGGRWSRSPFFTLPAYPVCEVRAKTLAIVGYGAIGRRVAQAARALGLRVVAVRIPGRKYPKKTRLERISLGEALCQADFLSVHAPLSDLTRDLIGRSEIRRMKRGAFLINMARGGIVDEKALAEALESGRLAGAASDVLSVEPPPADHVLLKAPNMLLTPHVAWASRESRTRLMREVFLNIRAFQRGRKRNRVV